MRTILTQGHATNLRDLILNYGLDSENKRIIDFNYGTGGFWRIDYPYRCELVKVDAIPTQEGIIKKDYTADDYSDLGSFDAGIFDPPYLYGHKAFDYSLKQPWADTKTWAEKQKEKDAIIPAQLQGKNSWGSSDLARFTSNKNLGEFLNRIKGMNRAASQCLKPAGLLFVKVMDTRHNGKLMANHVHIINNLTNFECWAINVYVAGGAKTWKSHSETSHGYWMVFKKKENEKLV